jgi:hypothetical protein
MMRRVERDLEKALKIVPGVGNPFDAMASRANAAKYMMVKRDSASPTRLAA